MNRYIRFINDQPFYTYQAQQEILRRWYTPGGLEGFTLTPEILSLRAISKVCANHYKNICNSLVDKVFKSFEILAGSKCNTSWKADIAKFLGWEEVDLEVLISPLQSGIDAICFNHNTQEGVSLELKHTKGMLRILSRRDNRGYVKGQCGVELKRTFKFHFATGTYEQKESNYQLELEKYKSGAEFCICFTIIPHLLALDVNDGILDAWLVSGRTLAEMLQEVKNNHWPIGFTPNFIVDNPRDIITLEKYDLNCDPRVYELASSMPAVPKN